MNVRFERLRLARVSPGKRGADLPVSVHGVLAGLVPGATIAIAHLARRCVAIAAPQARDPIFERRSHALAHPMVRQPAFERGNLVVALPSIGAPVFERRSLALASAVVRDPRFEARRMRPGAPVGRSAAVDLEKRWPTLAGTPFEFTLSARGAGEIASDTKFRLTGDAAMTRDQQLGLKGLFVILEGQRREIRDVIPNEDGSCDLIIHPPIALAAPVESFEPVEAKGTATVIADTRVKFVPDKTDTE